MNNNCTVFFHGLQKRKTPEDPFKAIVTYPCNKNAGTSQMERLFMYVGLPWPLLSFGEENER